MPKPPRYRKARVKGTHCFYCGNAVRPGSKIDGRQTVSDDQRLTADHILPLTFINQGAPAPPPNTRVLRTSCARCNEARAKLGHCTGALVAALAMPDGIAKLREWRGAFWREHQKSPDAEDRAKLRLMRKCSSSGDMA